MVPVIFAVLAVVAALAMVLARNAVHAALFLVATQIVLAILFLLEGAFFIAALQVIVYAGAIMVLFIFVVMLLGVDQKEVLVEHLSFQQPIAIGLGVALIAETVLLAIGRITQGTLGAAGPGLLQGEGNVEGVARVLFSRWAFPFEATSILLVVAVVGVIFLAKKRVQP